MDGGYKYSGGGEERGGNRQIEGVREATDFTSRSTAGAQQEEKTR